MKVTYHNTKLNEVVEGIVNGERVASTVRKLNSVENPAKFKRNHRNLVTASQRAIDGKRLTQSEFDILRR